MLDEPRRGGEGRGETLEFLFHEIDLARLVEGRQQGIPGFDTVRVGLDHTAKLVDSLFDPSDSGEGQTER